jgi:hypothetical protein
MKSYIDISNQRFGRLIALYPDGKDTSNTVKWRCLCDCGKESTVSGPHLRKGRIKSCGCLIVDTHVTHGMTGTPEYAAWNGMIGRCHNQSNQRWAHYGGRGITVCDEWRGDFVAFLNHVGKKPGAGFSIDRINVDGNYEPGNVRWASQKTQCRNRTNNVRHEYDGRSMTLPEWSDYLGVKEITLRKRIEAGMPPDRIFSVTHLQHSAIILPNRQKSRN